MYESGNPYEPRLFSQQPRFNPEELEEAVLPYDDSPDPPDGTIREVLAWVGEDKDRAKLALAAENEKAKPRTSLTQYLEGVLSEEG